MTREEYLKGKILEEFPSVRAFAEAIGMPNSTITSILKNVGGASLSNIKKICAGLEISANDLVHFDTVNKESTFPPVDYETKRAIDFIKTAEAAPILARAGELPQSDQKIILSQLESLVTALSKKEEK